MPYTPEQIKAFKEITSASISDGKGGRIFLADVLDQAARDARLRQGVEKLLNVCIGMTKNAQMLSEETRSELIRAENTGRFYIAADLQYRLRALLAETETPCG